MEYILTFIIIGVVIYIVLNNKKNKISNSNNNKTLKVTNNDTEEILNNLIDNIHFKISINGVSADVSEVISTTEFMGNDKSVSIAGKTIVSPMIYLDARSKKEQLPHIIYGDAKVEFSGLDEDLGYWPSYSLISPYSRGKFINWLEGGKKDIEIDIGLVFIYFYGLEFRAIYEKLNHKEILFEIIRLNQLYNFNGSFKGYSESLIAWLILSINDYSVDEKNILNNFMNRINFYSPIYSSGAYYKINNKEFSKDLLIQIISIYENTPRSRIPEKLGKIFNDYFLIKIEPMWDSIQSEVKYKQIAYHHHCASSIYQLREKAIVEGFNYYFPTSIKNKLANIWEQCIVELKLYSRKIGKATENELYLLLPKELRELYTHPFADSFNEFAEKKQNQVCKVNEVAEFLNISYSDKLSLKQSKDLCSTFEQMGLNIEPDARYFSDSYKWDDFIIFYQEENPGIPQKADYAIASMLFDLGVNIASADLKVDKEELDVAEDFIKNNFCTIEHDKIRINKRRQLAEVGAIKGKGIAKKLSERLKVSDLEKIGKYLFMISAVDGVIDKSEIRAIKRIFQDFGLSDEIFNAMLNDYKANSFIQDATKIRKGDKINKEGSIIPERAIVDQDTVKIDQNVLNAVLKDTENVKKILSSVFTSEPEMKTEPDKTIPVEEYYELPKELTSFVKLVLQKKSWDREDLRQLAIKNNIMLNSAIEKINYWWEGQKGDYLIYEEQGNYLVQQPVVEG
ncbi:MAG: TerB N-terminal domain-containing protein [Spirochaetes bacterium]|nr:TerB N-terminal domain-containing protein [Spirochaetota bacterium]